MTQMFSKAAPAPVIIQAPAPAPVPPAPTTTPPPVIPIPDPGSPSAVEAARQAQETVTASGRSSTILTQRRPVQQPQQRAGSNILTSAGRLQTIAGSGGGGGTGQPYSAPVLGGR